MILEVAGTTTRQSHIGFIMLRVGAGLLLLSRISPTAGFFEDRLRQMYHNDTMWPVTVAAFGNQIEEYYGTSFDLMLPPADDVNGTLCSVPDSLNATAEDTELSQYTYPIGLFVAVGDCSPETKARNLLAIQNMVPRVNYLVVYGTNSSLGTNQSIMVPDTLRDVEKLQQMAAIYVPTNFAVEILDRMWKQAAETNESPYFLDANNTEFWFRITVQKVPDSYSFDDNGSNPRGRTDSNDESYGDSFIWFRFVLFALLIVAPCVRAAFLWYQGGGRFIWRRNDHGRIVGLQYIPPMPYWLAAGRFIPTNQEAAPFTLTEEQFANLPEIKYEPMDPTERDDDDGEGETDGAIDENYEQPPINGVDEPEIVVDEPEIVVSTSGDSAVAAEKDEGIITEGTDLEKQENSSLQQCLDEVDGFDAAQSEEREPLEVVVTDDMASQGNHELTPIDTTPPNAIPTPATHEGEHNLNTTTCTACSICIDDFEEGEPLVLLPRCRHAFHKECLKPWLLERQGCCPLCKTDVLLSSEQETNDSASSLVGDHPEEDRMHAPSDTNQRDGRNLSVSEDPTDHEERLEL